MNDEVALGTSWYTQHLAWLYPHFHLVFAVWHSEMLPVSEIAHLIHHIGRMNIHPIELVRYR